MYAVLIVIAELRTPDVGNMNDVPETKLARPRFQNDLILAVRDGQLFRNLLRAIWAIVVDDNHLPGETTTLLHNAHVSGNKKKETF
jgi:hypothetical protein